MSDVTPHSVMEKFEFYFLGLTFTLLAASTQTADFALYSRVNSIIELSGWIALGLSGIVGLSKIEYLSSLIATRNNRDENANYSSQLQRAKAMGTPAVRVSQTGESKSIDEVITVLEENTRTWQSRLDSFGRTHEIKHHVQKYAFLGGLLLVATARAYVVLCP